jgi:hypothetical protein
LVLKKEKEKKKNLTKLIKNTKRQKNYDLRMRHFELREGHVEHHLQCPTIRVAMQKSLKVI